jgi:SNF2 family DNA or RNA helicase
MKIYPDHRAIVLPFRPDIEQIAPKAKRFEADGQWWLALPHRLEIVQLLRNMGIEAPSPILNYYDWNKGHPFESQKITADLLTVSKRAYVLSEMGVGKTRAVLYAYDYLRSLGVLTRLLVAAPLSTLTTVWENEIFENFPHLVTGVLYGDRKKRTRVLAQPADVYIINHDGVQVLHKELFERSDINGLVVDELAVYRNSRSARWRFMRPIVERSEYAWGLTGAPTPNAPTDAYGQVKLLTPRRVGFTFKSFRDATMRQVTTFKWVPRKDALDHVHTAMQPAVRFTREECFDLPETTYSTRAVALGAATQAAYKKMLNEFQVQIRRKEITAANEGVKLGKLLQLSAGFAYDSQGQGQYIGGVERIKEIVACIEQTEHKVIIFAGYRYLVELLGGVLGKLYTVGMVHGDVPKGQRDQIFMAFQKSSAPRLLVAHPGTMAHGLTLTEAATIIWASPLPSLEIYEQANARITRSGQKNKTHIIHIQATDAEKQVYDRLRRKAKLQGALLELFEEDGSKL